MSEEKTNEELKQQFDNFYKTKVGQNPPNENVTPKNPEKIIDSSDDLDMIKKYQDENYQKPDEFVIPREKIKLPSKGYFYKDKLSEVEVEYLTSIDEDILTTPSLLEDGTVINVLLERKIRTKGVNPENLLNGDISAILLYLRKSSYGHEYNVSVVDPRNGKEFPATVDLNKIKYKQIEEKPDDNGYFSVNTPLGKKNVKFRLLTSKEENMIAKNSESLKEEYNMKYGMYNTLRLKASIVSIGGESDRDYINRYVDAMRAGDSLAIRRKIMDVTPEMDMDYEFRANDGFAFKSKLRIDVDFFFPNN